MQPIVPVDRCEDRKLAFPKSRPVCFELGPFEESPQNETGIFGSESASSLNGWTVPIRNMCSNSVTLRHFFASMQRCPSFRIKLIIGKCFCLFVMPSDRCRF